MSDDLLFRQCCDRCGRQYRLNENGHCYLCVEELQKKVEPVDFAATLPLYTDEDLARLWCEHWERIYGMPTTCAFSAGWFYPDLKLGISIIPVDRNKIMDEIDKMANSKP